MKRHVLLLALFIWSFSGCAWEYCIESPFLHAAESSKPWIFSDFDNKELVDIMSNPWVAWGDALSQGKSQAKIEIESPGDQGTSYALRFDYFLQGSSQWNWPYSGFCTSMKNSVDLSRYQGVVLSIRSQKPSDRIDMSFYTVDKLSGEKKPCTYTISCTNAYQRVVIPFSRFPIAAWWRSRTPRFSPEIDWSQCTEINFTKSGASGEKGSFWVDQIAFYVETFEGKELGTIPAPTYKQISGPGEGEGIKPIASVAVNLNQPFVAPDSRLKGRISPTLYGSNWGSFLGAFPSAEKVRPLNIKTLRVGGLQMSRYNWRSSKFTLPGIPAVYSQPSVEEFVQYCRSIGAEPVIQVNAMGWAPNPDKNNAMDRCMSAKDAADLVTYLNGIKKYGVKYFQIDNEFDTWHYSHKDLWGAKPCSGQEYLKRYLNFALAMKEAQAAIGSPEDIKLIGPEISSPLTNWSSWDPSETNGGLKSFVPFFLRECKRFEEDKTKNPKGFRVLDILSFHLYPRFRTDYKDPMSFIPQGIPKMLESVQTWWNPDYINHYDYDQPRNVALQTIPRFNRWINEYYPGLQLAITEFGVDSASSIVYDPVVKPLYLADLYGVFAKYGVEYTMQFCLNGDDGSMEAINQYNEIRPIYYPMMLYAQHFKGTVLTTEDDQGDLLNVYACDDGEGSIVLMAVNKDDSDIKTRIDLSGYTGKAVENSFYYTFKRSSMTCIKIPKNGPKTVAESWEYGREQILEEANFKPI